MAKLDHTTEAEAHSSRSSPRLLDLPPELRLIIYDMSFRTQDPQYRQQSAKNVKTATALLHTCRQTFSEVIPYLPEILKKHTLVLEIQRVRLHSMMAQENPNSRSYANDLARYQHRVIVVQKSIERTEKKLTVAEARLKRAKD